MSHNTKHFDFTGTSLIGGNHEPGFMGIKSFSGNTYDTFSPSRDNFDDMTSEDKMFCCGKWCTASLLLVISTILLIFNSVSIHIALDNANATCYQYSKVMTMSNYVLLNSSVGVVTNSIMIIAVIVALVVGFQMKAFVIGVITLVPLLLIMGLFSLVMAILGTIILAYNFPLCNNEIHTVCALVIVIVILSFISVVTNFGGSRVNNK